MKQIRKLVLCLLLLSLLSGCAGGAPVPAPQDSAAPTAEPTPVQAASDGVRVSDIGSFLAALAPGAVIELAGDSITGPFEPVPAFTDSLSFLEAGKHEAPTAVQLDDGRWCLFLDYYGVRGAGQGYRPYVAETLAGGKFVLKDDAFFFPYRFKHGTILKITEEEYRRMKDRDWLDVEDRR